MEAKSVTKNALFYSDDPEVLREYLLDESVDPLWSEPNCKMM